MAQAIGVGEGHTGSISDSSLLRHRGPDTRSPPADSFGCMKNPRPNKRPESPQPDKPGKLPIDEDDAQIEESEEDPFEEDDGDTANVSE